MHRLLHIHTIEHKAKLLPATRKQRSITRPEARQNDTNGDQWREEGHYLFRPDLLRKGRGGGWFKFQV